MLVVSECEIEEVSERREGEREGKREGREGEREVKQEGHTHLPWYAAHVIALNPSSLTAFFCAPLETRNRTCRCKCRSRCRGRG